MRIWCQSSTTLVADPMWSSYRESLSRHVQEVKRADTQFEIHGVQFVHPLMDHSAYVRYLNEGLVIKNALRAEKEGYDGFAIATTLDPGYLEIRNIVNIPVAFLGENCFHIASLLADKFSMLACNKDLYLILNRQIRQYCLEDKFLPCESFEISELELVDGFEDPGPIIDVVKKIAKKAIERGAGILVPACNILNMVLHNAGLREIDGVPLLDTTAVMVKAAEFLVDLEGVGISRSKAGLYSPLSKDELASVIDTYHIK